MYLIECKNLVMVCSAGPCWRQILATQARLKTSSDKALPCVPSESHSQPAALLATSQSHQQRYQSTMPTSCHRLCCAHCDGKVYRQPLLQDTYYNSISSTAMIPQNQSNRRNARYTTWCPIWCCYACDIIAHIIHSLFSHYL